MGVLKVVGGVGAACGAVFCVDVASRVYLDYGHAHLTLPEYAEKFQFFATQRWNELSLLARKQWTALATQSQVTASDAKAAVVAEEKKLVETVSSWHDSVRKDKKQ